jgi:lambda family phage portal protein
MAPIYVGAVVDNRPPPRKRAEPSRNALRTRGSGWQVYDAAQTTDQNRRHWANADSLSPLSANDPNTRRKLRDRSRYEQGSNGYLRGAMKTAKNDLVGRKGPRFRFGFPDAEANAWLDLEFARWMKAVGLRRKLKTFVGAKKGDGEGLALLTTNPTLTTPVKLDLKLFEAEQLTTPTFLYGRRGELKDRNGNLALWATDGILFDNHGNPTEYHVLKNHPGDGWSMDPLGFDRHPAEAVIHWFDCDRPGQCRGVPDTVTALPLCAMLRRFSMASLQAAEIQADFTAVLETDGAGESDDPPVDIPSLEIERGTIPTLPDKYKLHAFDPTHPTATYPQFKREILCEIGRGMQMPYNVIASDSSSHNYSSARLDTQEYQDDVCDERTDVEEIFLERIKDAWLEEALSIPGYVPFQLGEFETAPGAWYWTGWNYIDPVKEVTAIQIRLENNLTTLKAEHAKNGDDWIEVLRQRAAEIALCKELGIPLANALPSPADPTHPANRPETEPAPPPRREPDAPARPRRKEVAKWLTNV